MISNPLAVVVALAAIVYLAIWLEAAPDLRSVAPDAHVFASSLRAVSVRDTAALALLAVGAVWMAGRLAAWIPQIPEVLWLTTLVLVVAQFGPVRALAGGPMWGNYLLQLFLATIGAQSIVVEIVRVGPAVFWFTLIVVGIHGLLLFGVGRAVGLDLPTLAVASQANVGGPASAMALASARGFADRLLPGVVVGILGTRSATTRGSQWPP